MRPAASEIKEVFELVPYFPEGIMHPASSSDKHFSSEKTYHEGGSESQVLTKMSSTVTHSSTMSTKKEFLSSTVTSTLSQSGHEPTSVCTKTTVQSSEQAVSENGAPPVVQVNILNTSVLCNISVKVLAYAYFIFTSSIERKYELLINSKY